MRGSTLSLMAGFSLLALPAAGLAQQHIAPSATLDAIAAAHTEALDADRTALRAFLARPEVARIAAEGGIDIMSARAAVAVLGAEEVRKLSQQVSQVDAMLAGGDTITISTTAIVIALLILIIILVA